MAGCAHTIGLIAAGIHPGPIGHADVVTADSHKTFRGPHGGFILCKKEHQERIDRAVFPFMQGGPFMHAIAAKAFAFHQAQTAAFKAYTHQAIINAQAMVDVFKELDYRIVSNGTDTHLFVIDLSNRSITGLEAEKKLEKAGIYVSRSTIPFDTQKPSITSGIRIGTLAITSRSYTKKDAQEVAHLINTLLTQ